jgi:hypothetical protein
MCTSLAIALGVLALALVVVGVVLFSIMRVLQDVAYRDNFRPFIAGRLMRWTVDGSTPN